MKIALLAMSGVRACDQKLLQLGLTLPAFVDRSQVVASLPSLGLLSLAAVTPKHHTLQYFESEDLNKQIEGKQTLDEIFDEFDVVAFSTMTAQAFEAYEMADQLRALDKIVIFGGLHASVCPVEVGQHADYVLVGEGEAVWVDLLIAAEKREDCGVWNSSELPPVDINSLPAPRYELLEREKYNRFTIQTSRGCPWRCEFCASSIMLSKKYRKKSVKKVIQEISYLKRFHEKPYIEFADDNTFVDKKWGKELCQALIPLGLSWFTETDVTVGEDDELLKLMKLSGCKQVLLGLESPIEIGLEGMEINSDFKQRVFQKNKFLVQNIQAHGITVNGCFILGLDGHDSSIFEKIYHMVDELYLYECQITVLTAFPGTPLYHRLKKEGRIIEDKAWNKATLFDVNFIPQKMTVNELQE